MADLCCANLWNGHGHSGNPAELNARILRFRDKTHGKAEVGCRSTPPAVSALSRRSG